MVGFRVRRPRSWMANDASRMMCAALRERLLGRCQGEKGVFLTLTYRREQWDGPDDLYRRSADERHVRLFVRKLEKVLREKLTGRWLAKLEFQEGGWVHWHLLVLGVEYIDHARLTACWGFGFTWIKRMTPKTIAYVCKYVSKEGELPAFLYAERMRSVRVVRSSPGFWRDVKRRYAGMPCERMPFYRTVGDLVEDAGNRCILKDRDTGRFQSRRCVPLDLVRELRRCGGRVVEFRDGWLWFAGVSLSDLGSRGPRAAERPGPRPLHLKDTPHPHNPGAPGRWVDRFFEFVFGWRDVAGS